MRTDGGRPGPHPVLCTLIQPPHPITHFATRLYHLTDHDVATAPRWAQIAPAVCDTLQGAWIAAHNAHVDFQALTRHLPGWEPAAVVDTLRLARAALPQAPGHSLDALPAHTGITVTDIPGRRHRAAFDAHATARLLLTLAGRYPTWDALTAVAVPPGLPGATAAKHEEQTLW
ncbi:3'-5' exonuclease [Planomonospora sp. ID91781]|uniref:3'-5' exonuclease n=1 Tax=Planomonospora sp. ID91781 TaxID=2738135 RepID=UPI0018C36432|nr:3'-5' exonuclease [Planomonospora sp. ID91781]MBG0823337.1 3'-5' exonuclease [Planomonospora sp. ID91781]